MPAVARLALLLGISLFAPHALAGAPVSETGELQGAPWRIDVPDNWNGELIMLAHGFEPVGTPRPSAWPANEATPALLGAGYAVAQSGYRTQGWAVADAIADTERLRQHFIAGHPDTRRTWILGYSMGGAIAVASLERQSRHYDGGVALCGATLPGDTLAGDLLTTLVAFDYFFPKAEGLPMDGLASPAAAALPQMQLHQGIAAALQTQPETAQRLATRMEVTPEELAGVISLHALVFHDMARRYGGMPVGNQDTVYAGFGDDAAFNAGVKRYPADPAVSARFTDELALTGALKRPLVIQFNHRDPTIVPRMQGVYPQLAAKAGATPLPTVLPAAGEGHCGFSDEQTVAALKVLANKAEETPAP